MDVIKPDSCLNISVAAKMINLDKLRVCCSCAANCSQDIDYFSSDGTDLCPNFYPDDISVDVEVVKK